MKSDILKIKVYDQNGEVVGEEKLEPAIFGVAVKPVVVHQVVVAHLAAQRAAVAHTKTKGKVRGGGRKPWKQKGTGRARAGSTRSPLWRGGGIIFGPDANRVFTQKINQKVKRAALFMVLSDKVKNERLILIDKINLTDFKTKSLIKILEKLPVKNQKTMIITDKKEENLIRAAGNLSKVEVIKADSLNVYDVLNYHYLLVPKASLEVIKKTFLQ